MGIEDTSVDTSTESQNTNVNDGSEVIDSQVESTDEQNQEEESAEPEYEIGGQKYKATMLQQAIEALNNKEKWQKTQTQRDQELAAERKKYKEIETKLPIYKEYDEIHESFDADPILADRFKQLRLERAEEIANDPEQKQQREIHELRRQNAQLEQRFEEVQTGIRRQSLAGEALALQKSEGLTSEELDQVLDLAVKSRGALDLETAYFKLYKDKVIAKAIQTAQKQTLDDIKKKGKQTVVKPGTPQKSGQQNKGLPDIQQWMKDGKPIDDWMKLAEKQKAS